MQSKTDKLFYYDKFKKKPKHNTDGLVNCLRQPGQLHLDEKHFTI